MASSTVPPPPPAPDTAGPSGPVPGTKIAAPVKNPAAQKSATQNPAAAKPAATQNPAAAKPEPAAPSPIEAAAAPAPASASAPSSAGAASTSIVASTRLDPYSPLAPATPYGGPALSPYGGVPVGPSSTLSVLALVFGIVGLVFSFFLFGLLPAIGGVVLGHLALKREPHARGMAIGGLVTGYIGVAISLLWGLVILVPTLLLFFAALGFGAVGLRG